MTARQRLKSDILATQNIISARVASGKPISELEKKLWETKLTVLYRHYLCLDTAWARYQTEWIMKRLGVK